MKYMIATIMTLIFTMSLALAQGGGSPSIEKLHKQSLNDK